MIVSAAASAQSVPGLHCAVGSAIKTIVAIGALPGGDLAKQRAKALILAPLLHSTQPEETKRRNDFATDATGRRLEHVSTRRKDRSRPPPSLWVQNKLRDEVQPEPRTGQTS